MSDATHTTIPFEMTSEELDAIAELMRMQDLSMQHVLRQALRVYQAQVKGVPDLGPLLAPDQRLPFDQETLLRCKQFATELMSDVPELEGIALIPSFDPPQEHVPYGLVTGRNGGLRTPKEIQHMAVQVHGCLRQQLENVYQVLLGTDAEMSKLAKEIRDKQQKLAELNAATNDALDRYVAARYKQEDDGASADERCTGRGTASGDS